MVAPETTESVLRPPGDRPRSLLAYATIAFMISWAIEIPLALIAQGIVTWNIPFTVHYLASFGPAVAGILLTWRESGTVGLRDLFSRIVKWRVGIAWWITALSPVIVFFLVALVMSQVRQAPFDISILNHFDFLPDIGVAAVLVWLATYGFGEETGWRGYLLPRLQRNQSARTATLILWVIWAIWHIPSFFYLHTAPSVGALIGFLVGLLAGAFFLTWLYNSTGGSILLVSVWHGLFDYVTACTDCKSGVVAATVSTIVMVWAVVVLIAYKHDNLAGRPRHSL